MSETMSVQWFPGHMAKTRRIMASNLKLVDLVVELCDARIPQSSRNPEIDKIVGKKPRLMLLNKADCADAAATEQWLTYYRKKGIPAIACDCRSGRGVKNLLPAVREVLADRIASWQEKGMVGRPIRMMIVGIPNVGKSSLINRLSGTRSAKVEDRPGVTRGKQWVSLEEGIELLDMPGVLWPKFEDKIAGERLAFIGSVKDQILDIEYLAVRLLDTLRPAYTGAIAERYRLEAEQVADMEAYELLEAIGRKRGMLDAEMKEKDAAYATRQQEAAKSAEDAKAARQEKLAGELQELMDEFPERVKAARDVPQSVYADAQKNGRSLLDAYLRYDRAEAKKVNAAKAAAASAAESTAGSQRDTAPAQSPNPFMDALARGMKAGLRGK